LFVGLNVFQPRTMAQFFREIECAINQAAIIAAVNADDLAFRANTKGFGFQHLGVNPKADQVIVIAAALGEAIAIGFKGFTEFTRGIGSGRMAVVVNQCDLLRECRCCKQAGQEPATEYYFFHILNLFYMDSSQTKGRTTLSPSLKNALCLGIYL